MTMTENDETMTCSCCGGALPGEHGPELDALDRYLTYGGDCPGHITGDCYCGAWEEEAYQVQSCCREAGDVDWGDVDGYYDVEEAEAKRQAWDESGESWESERDEAIEAARRGDDDTCRDHLRCMRRIETEWGDDPATCRVADALRVSID